MHKYEQMWIGNSFFAYCRCGEWAKGNDNGRQQIDQRMDQLRSAYANHIVDLVEGEAREKQ